MSTTENARPRMRPGLVALLVIVTVAALAGIVGAWLRRQWGPPLLLAGLLWFLAG